MTNNKLISGSKILLIVIAGLTTNLSYGMMKQLCAHFTQVVSSLEGVQNQTTYTSLPAPLEGVQNQTTYTSLPAPLKYPTIYLVSKTVIKKAPYVYDPITLLYQNPYAPLTLSLSKQEISLCNTPAILKEEFRKNRIMTAKAFVFERGPEWDLKQWTTAYQKLINLDNFPQSTMTLGNALQFLEDVKSILRSFLAPQDFAPIAPSFRDGLSMLRSYFNYKQCDISEYRTEFFQKGSLARIFTYAKLQQVIKQKKLLRVHLPRKVLAIKDKETGCWLTKNTASLLLEELICLVIENSEDPKIKIDYDEFGKFGFYIFAEKQPRSEAPLSEEALKQLIELIKEAPFDIGFDNIFTNENGDAVIIDTEFKGEPATDCIRKLIERYTPDPSIFQEYFESITKSGR
jgi:hypothetical protein